MLYIKLNLVSLSPPRELKFWKFVGKCKFVGIKECKYIADRVKEKNMFDAKIINSFLQGINSTFSALFQTDIKIGKIYIKGSEFKGDDLLIFVGITGSYKGQSVISMGMETAKELAKRMMGDLNVNQININYVKPAKCFV